MKTKEIGSLKGPVLLFGGVYSNLQSLQKVQSLAAEMKIKPSNVICTGDILGYCAQPNECLDLIRTWGIHSITGNVEVNIRNEQEDCGCNFDEGSRCDLLSNNWYAYTQANITPENKEWLHTLPDFIRFQYANQEAFVLHGGLDDNAQFIFESTEWQIKKEIIQKADTDLIIAGHCGLPFHSESNGKHWLNPGVIGMPANDGTSRVWCMALNTNREKVTSRHVDYNYDHVTAAKLMNINHLPASYAETLSTGLWDNMEILNDEEKVMQGMPLSFE